jgi:hypothetical protein
MTAGLLIEMGLPIGYQPFIRKWFASAGVVEPDGRYLDPSFYPFDATITGLKARPELNGRHGTVLRFIFDGQFAGRLAVRVDGKMVALKASNVIAIHV